MDCGMKESEYMKSSCGYYFMQMFSPRLLSNLSTFLDGELLKSAKHIPGGNLSKRWGVRTNMHDERLLLLLDYGTADILFKDSAVLHKDIELVVFVGILREAGVSVE